MLVDKNPVLSNSPLLIEAEEGRTVFYSNRYLYSRYKPASSVLKVIENFLPSILPNSLIYLPSPLLCYGLERLLEVAKKTSSFLLIVEKDATLLNLTKSALLLNSYTNAPIYLETAATISTFIDNINTPRSTLYGKFRRIIRINLSAGHTLFSSFYDKIQEEVQEAITKYYSNRATLIKFGFLYSKNFFINLANYQTNSFAYSLASLLKTVSKPLLVAAAGPSVLSTIKDLNLKERQEEFFIIAVDAVLPLFMKLKIKVDALVTEEAQVAILPSFIGASYYPRAIIRSLSSHPVNDFFKVPVFYYAVSYYPAAFISTISRSFLSFPPLPPLSSVGLTATYIATLIRVNSKVPIYLSGLDFSYPPFLTHCKESMQFNKAFYTTNRLKSFYDAGTTYGINCRKIKDIAGNIAITNRLLLNYATLFSALFSNTLNLFDLRQAGIKLNIPTFLPEEVKFLPSISKEKREEERIECSKKGSAFIEYIRKEIAALEEVRSLITTNFSVLQDATSKRLYYLLQERQYLYLHFADTTGEISEDKLQEESFLSRLVATAGYFINLFNRTTGGMGKKGY